MKKQIRDTILAALTSLPELRTVAIGRRHELNIKQLPAAIIYTDNHETERITCTPATYAHQIELKIILSIRPTSLTSGEDETDNTLAAIDALILPEIQAMEGIYDILPISIATEGNGEADADYLQTTRTYQIEYQTPA